MDCQAPHRTASVHRAFSCFIALAAAVALGACLPEKKEVIPDEALTFENFVGQGVIFAGQPGLEFPYSGLPKDYALECAQLHKLLTEELGIGHVTQPMKVRKLLGHSQYQQMMVSAARNGMPHWTYLDQLNKHYPHHAFAIFLQQSPVTEFRNHLVTPGDKGRALQTVSELRGDMRFLVVNMGGLKKLSMDVKLRKSLRRSQLHHEASHDGVREALLQPTLRVKPEWYPPYPPEDDLRRDIIREFIALLNRNPSRR